MDNDPARVLKLKDLFQISGWQHRLAWKPFQDGVEIYRLYGDGETGPTAALLRFRAGARVPLHEHTGYEHIFVLSGEQVIHFEADSIERRFPPKIIRHHKLQVMHKVRRVLEQDRCDGIH